MNNPEDRSAPPSSPSLEGIGFLGSIFWSHTNDKCENHHNHKSKSHNGHLARRPRYHMDQPQNKYQQEPRKKIVETNLLSTSMPEDVSRVHTPPPVECIVLNTSFPGFSTRHVHFSLDDKQNPQQVKPSAKKVVSRLPWTNHKGDNGAYTGHVNENMQPHGSGAFINEDGKSKTCIWKYGMPVQGWKPKKPKKNNLKKLNHDNQEAQHPTSSYTSSDTSCDTYLHHLDLGDAATPQDMQEYSDPIKMYSLQVHDFAFILRSDGEWTYSIIADRQDDGILFVVDTEGSTKTLSRKHWSARIRLVNTEKHAWSSSPSSVSHLTGDGDSTQVIAYPIGAFPPPPFGQSSSACRAALRPQVPRSSRSSSDGSAAVVRHMKDIRRQPPDVRRQSPFGDSGALHLFD